MGCFNSTLQYLILNLKKKKPYIIHNAKIMILQCNNRWKLQAVTQ
jgi:hypothetical protein